MSAVDPALLACIFLFTDLPVRLLLPSYTPNSFYEDAGYTSTNVITLAYGI